MKDELPRDVGIEKLSAREGLVRHYKKLLKARESGGGRLEAMTGSAGTTGAEPDLSDSGISERLNSTRGVLRRIIHEHLGDKPELYEIAEKILVDGGEALRVLRAEDHQHLAERSDVMESLEAIVRTDGSRPSFMVRNGTADLTTSPAGAWSDSVTVSMDLLKDTLDCVGRIDVVGSPQGFQGTAFLIHENLIITNRHVLQVTADSNEDGTWTMKPGTAVDFGHEFRARDSLNRRLLRRVVFCGHEPILDLIDHRKLDLALIELEPAERALKPRVVLSVDAAQDWAQPPLPIYIIGYPGSPSAGLAPPTLLEQLFQSTFGYKRLAPGLLMRSQAEVDSWTVTHDATTLGGNSGSVVLVIGREHAAAGLHYGGRWGKPRENWGHILGRVLDDPGSCSPKTLRQHFADFGVHLMDRMNS